MEDLVGFRCLIAVDDPSEIPESLSITLGDCIVAVSVILESTAPFGGDDRGTPFVGGDPNEGGDQTDHLGRQLARRVFNTGDAGEGGDSREGVRAGDSSSCNSFEMRDRHRSSALGTPALARAVPTDSDAPAGRRLNVALSKVESFPLGRGSRSSDEGVGPLPSLALTVPPPAMLSRGCMVEEGSLALRCAGDSSLLDLGPRSASGESPRGVPLEEMVDEVREGGTLERASQLFSFCPRHLMAPRLVCGFFSEVVEAGPLDVALGGPSSGKRMEPVGPLFLTGRWDGLGCAGGLVFWGPPGTGPPISLVFGIPRPPIVGSALWGAPLWTQVEGALRRHALKVVSWAVEAVGPREEGSMFYRPGVTMRSRVASPVGAHNVFSSSLLLSSARGASSRPSEEGSFPTLPPPGGWSGEDPPWGVWAPEHRGGHEARGNSCGGHHLEIFDFPSLGSGEEVRFGALDAPRVGRLRCGKGTLPANFEHFRTPRRSSRLANRAEVHSLEKAVARKAAVRDGMARDSAHTTRGVHAVLSTNLVTSASHKVIKKGAKCGIMLGEDEVRTFLEFLKTSA